MDPARIAQAAALLAAARRQHLRIGNLPASCAPQTIADAHAIQDAVTALTGEKPGAWKANLPKHVRAPIYARSIRASPARIPGPEAPQRGIEGEVAFRFRRDFPPRPAPYPADEVAASLEACAAIETVTSRFADPESAPFLDRLADCVSNAGFVHGATLGDWRRLDLATLRVTLIVNGEIVSDQPGGHPSGDPLAIAVALVEMLRGAGGVTAGQFVTCGSYTGLRYLPRGASCEVKFAGLGAAELAFL